MLPYVSLHDFPIHKRALSLLIKSIESKHIHHAYLLHGEEGSGKLAAAFTFAKHLVCTKNMLVPCNECTSCLKANSFQHPDIQLFFPTNKKSEGADPKTVQEGLDHYKQNLFKSFKIGLPKSHFVETIRQIKSDSKYPPHEAKRKIYLLHEIEYMNDASANAFLKLMEEPPPNTIILLTTSRPNQILPTIQSRCQKLYFGHLSESQLAEIGKLYTPNIPENHLAFKLADGNLSKMFEYLETDFTPLRQDVLNFLRYSIVNKPVPLMQIVEQLTKKKDKDKLNDFLSLMLYWFQDVNLLHSQIQPLNLINVDLVNELTKFTARYGEKDLLTISSVIEDARYALQANVHPSMTLSNLAIELKQQLTN